MVLSDHRQSLREIRRHIQSVIDALDSRASNDDSVDRLAEIHANWPDMLSTELKDSLVADFKNQTSSRALKLFVCACCGEAMFRDNCGELSSEL